ncbi:hypothetical protein H4696_009765 [Amycolatopsis lexingtonensis]|uniref:Uncharacterized protein n=1 Tax=Amycolatopsis lexingtonensis TaxID=218822 RepID=A0ABR9IHK8_9PSEU|nr:hypothetical protein [Amycolatopsis lexingtonensis]MBE1502665.1 hypothetical protein [Amycolatopsis lexingtonensis]
MGFLKKAIAAFDASAEWAANRDNTYVVASTKGVNTTAKRTCVGCSKKAKPGLLHCGANRCALASAKVQF